MLHAWLPKYAAVILSTLFHDSSMIPSPHQSGPTVLRITSIATPRYEQNKGNDAHPLLLVHSPISLDEWGYILYIDAASTCTRTTNILLNDEAVSHSDHPPTHPLTRYWPRDYTLGSLARPIRYPLSATRYHPISSIWQPRVRSVRWSQSFIHPSSFIKESYKPVSLIHLFQDLRRQRILW